MPSKLASTGKTAKAQPTQAKPGEAVSPGLATRSKAAGEKQIKVAAASGSEGLSSGGAKQPRKAGGSGGKGHGAGLQKK